MTTTSSKLKILHESVSHRADALHTRHAAFTQCKSGCADCCQDELTVFDVEAHRIVHFFEHNTSATLTLHPPGQCAFLHPQTRDCQIYEVRPYVCRTQGLPLRILEESDDGWDEYRDICPLNDDPDHPIEMLTADDCWEIGPVEESLWRLTADSGSGSPIERRLKLRAIAQDIGASPR